MHQFFCLRAFTAIFLKKPAYASQQLSETGKKHTYIKETSPATANSSLALPDMRRKLTLWR